MNEPPVLAYAAALSLAIAIAGCGLTEPTLPSVATPSNAAVSLHERDIVYHRAANGTTEITLVIGLGTNAQNAVFECHVFTPTPNDDWSCGLPARLRTDQDYWVYVVDNRSPAAPIGLQGGSVRIRGKEVTRTIRISDSRGTGTAGLFGIVDTNGTIR